MLFSTDDDDIDFGVSPGGGSSKLAGLFSDQDEAKNGNQSLKYTAPKQPKKTEVQSATGAQTVLHAVGVTAFKYDGGKYNNQGKVGAAVVGSHNPPLYKIIVYKTKQQQLTTVTMTPSFEFTIQPNNYANFYDDQNINWSVLFGGEQAACDFAKQVALCKANSAGPSLSTTVVQDLTLGEGNEVLENGDSIEVKYTGWVLTNFTFGEIFDTNENANKFLRLKLGKGKAIKGMEDGLLGARKNAKRLLIIPPSLGYGNQAVGNKIPPNSTLVFEVFVNKVKFARESRSSTPTTYEVDSGSDSRRKDTLVKPHSESVSSEGTVRARGASISEQLSQSPKTEKAKIILRMAKMGTSLLPMQSGTQPSSESETEDEMQVKIKGSPSFQSETASREQSPKPVPRPRSASNATIAPQQQSQPAPLPAQQMAVLQPQQQYLSSNTYPFPYLSATTAPFNVLQQPFPSHAVATASPTVMTSVADSHFPILLAEARTQNTEVRLTLGKISEKIDVALHKLDNINQQSGFSGQVPYLESSVLLQNIQRIVQENNKLKQEMEDKNSKIQILNEKICDLLQRNQRFIEESNNMLEQRSDSLHSTASQSHARLLTLEQERVKLTAELSETISKLSTLQMELTARQQTEAELQTQLHILANDVQKRKQEVETYKLKFEEQESLINTLQSSIKETRQQKRELENRIENLEETSLDLKNAKGILEKNLVDKKQQLNNAQELAEKEMEEMRTSHEKEIEVLRNKLLKQRTLPSSEQVSQLESDIEEKWKKHSEQMISEAKEKFRKEINELREQKEEVEDKLKEVESNLERTRVSHRSENDRIYELEEEIQQLKQWKDMYESLRRNAETMKKQHEMQVLQLTRQLSQLPGVPADNLAFASDLKTAMNKLYRSLQGLFQPEDSYTGSTIRQLALNVIREITFEILELKQNAPPIPPAVDETDNTAKAKEEVKEEERAVSNASEELESDVQTEEKTIPSNITEEVTEVTQIENSEEAAAVEELANEIQSLQMNDSESSKLEIPVSELRNGSLEAQESLTAKTVEPSVDSSTIEKDTSLHESTSIQKEQQSELSTVELINSHSDSGNPPETVDAPTTNQIETDKKITDQDSSRKESVENDSKAEKSVPESKKKEDLLDLSWKPQPPPPPLFDDDDEDEDDWLK